MKAHIVLADNGGQFTPNPQWLPDECSFNRICQKFDVEHRRTYKPTAKSNA